MTARIKEMWETATASIWPRPGKCTAGEYDYNLQKFAELIVRECAQLALDTDLEDVEGGDSEVLRAANRQILDHFGIK